MQRLLTLALISAVRYFQTTPASLVGVNNMSETLPRMPVILDSDLHNTIILPPDVRTVATLFYADGHIEKQLSDDEFCIRDGGIYKKVKNKWVLLLDVRGISYFTQ